MIHKIYFVGVEASRYNREEGHPILLEVSIAENFSVVLSEQLSAYTVQVLTALLEVVLFSNIVTLSLGKVSLNLYA